MGETIKGKKAGVILIKEGHSLKRDILYEQWDINFGIGSYDYVVYSLLDDRFPGPHTYGPLTFKYVPFYIGHGEAKKRAQKSGNYLQHAGEYTLKTKKMEEIFKVTGNRFMRTKIISSFKTKNKAALVEKKVIQLIRDCGHVLDNSSFNRCDIPLTADDYKLMNDNPNHILTM